MRDYANVVKTLRYCADRPICFSTQCDYRQTTHIGACFDSLKHDAADAIEELLTAVHSVVHCKDCRWCHAGYCEKYDDLIPWGCANKPWEDWFCADGKRPEQPKEVE